MRITDWPIDERPREKLLVRGAKALSDAELVAIFLRTGVPGQTALDLARELITTFGGLRPMLEASRHEFCRAKGLEKPSTRSYRPLSKLAGVTKRPSWFAAMRFAAHGTRALIYPHTCVATRSKYSPAYSLIIVTG